MPTVSVTRRARFSAARRLRRADWSEAQNLVSYGELTRLHGHDFVLDVTVRGEAGTASGMVVDLKALKALLIEVAVAPLNRRDLADTPLLAGQVPSTENLLAALWRQLSERLEAGLKLVEVRVEEGVGRSVAYRGEA